MATCQHMADGPNKILATPQTISNQWFLTKVSTAVAKLQLQEKGLFRIEGPVGEHLVFFDVQYPCVDSEVITIQHL